MELKMKKEINEKLERFIDRADTKFDLAGEMFDKLQKQIKELDNRVIKVNNRTSLLTNDSGDCILDINNKIKELEQKANRTGQFHLDAVNEKINKLENKISALNAKNQKRADAIKILNDKVEYDYKKLEGNIGAVTTAHNMGVELAKEDSAYNHNKIENNGRLLQDATRKIFLNIDTINDSVDNNKNDINKIYGLLKSGNIAFKEDYDILEGKYHQLRSELDCVYKVLEMDALDIQDLYEQLENHPNKGVKNAK